ncbi:MAG: hypothetical protein HDT27_02760 [Subdoligranulum sp.]|nr:hypothetical protein [Subdoligranulum sp.]
MITECVAILAISLCMIALYVRTGHGDYALSTTPILIVPAVHLVALPVSRWTDPIFSGFPPQSIVAFADIGAVAITGLLIMFFAGKIKSAKIKKLYVCTLGGYSIILACAFVHKTLSVLWR